MNFEANEMGLDANVILVQMANKINKPRIFFFKTDNSKPKIQDNSI